jgi:hypothetical protein
MDGRAAHRQPPSRKEQLVHRSYRTRHPDALPGWGAAPGWGQSFPGWSPLVDNGPLPLRAASLVARWWWPIVALATFGTVTGLVIGHDHPAPGLSVRGLVTIALAAQVVVLLTLHRAAGPGPLTRAVAEYTVMALLAGLLATAGAVVDQQPANHATPDHAAATPDAQATAGDDQPAVIRTVTTALRAGAKVVRSVTGAVRWLVDLWRQADQQTTPNGEAMPAPPPPAPAIWRFHS